MKFFKLKFKYFNFLFDKEVKLQKFGNCILFIRMYRVNLKELQRKLNGMPTSSALKTGLPNNFPYNGRRVLRQA